MHKKNKKYQLFLFIELKTYAIVKQYRGYYYDDYEGSKRMKLSVTYLVTILKYGYPPKPEDDIRSLEYLNRLGFHYLEMEGLGKHHADNLKKNLKIYKQALTDNGIHIHNFCCVDPDMVSIDKNKRQTALEHYKEMAEIGFELGAETLHLASYAPPVKYLGRAPYQLDGGEYEFGTKSRIRIPDDFDWQRVWDTVVESSRFCAEYAKSLGKIVIMEPRVGEVVCSVDSMIHLLDDVGCDALKANLDTGHFSAQREDVCLALKKLEGRYANIHMADNDPRDSEHLPLGSGSIDWEEFFRILVQQDYQGYLGIDLGAKDDEQLEKWLIQSRDYAAAAAKAAGAELTW